MAPLFEACRLASLLAFVISVFLSVSNWYSPLVYDRQLLLDIHDSFVTTYNSELGSSVAGSQLCFPNLALDIPEYLRRWPHDVSGKKRRRRRGKRRGVVVKLKMELHTGHVSISVMQNPGSGRCADWCWLDPLVRWLQPILPDSPSIFQDSPPTISCHLPICVHHGGATLQKLHTLNKASTSVISAPPSRMALINARSLMNKTYRQSLPATEREAVSSGTRTLQPLSWFANACRTLPAVSPWVCRGHSLIYCLSHITLLVGDLQVLSINPVCLEFGQDDCG
ncbi:hypothetical protein DPX16_4820 [Anabarilius grahami]|uniref:Uncharacterized protein n=1 Tax=Anabarilius grahami TaxID=495550 RepID=A0A3N0ZAL6_ANAGA|nr:hypothetical protein DPX16_4820 [Anabarilius grahami]